MVPRKEMLNIGLRYI